MPLTTAEKTVLHNHICDVLESHVEPLFKKDTMKITLIARDPANPDCFVLLTQESDDGLAALAAEIPAMKLRDCEVPDGWITHGKGVVR